jgi:hypothetical protein
MSKSIKPDQLADAIQQELTLYGKEVTEGVNDKGREAMKKLVKLTKASAPTGRRGRFKKSIAMKEEDAGNGSKKFTWYVKPPEHRLTHLLVHGHAKKNGGRTKADPFLKNALDAVLPEYEQAVEEVIQK